MIVIKIDDDYTPELKDAIQNLFGRFNVVNISVNETDEKPATIDPKTRVGGESSDLGAGLSSAVDRAVAQKRGQR